MGERGRGRKAPFFCLRTQRSYRDTKTSYRGSGVAIRRRRTDPFFIASFVRMLILVWSAGLLTASYMNLVKNPDEAFIASIFTATLSTFGIEKMNKPESKLSPKKPVNRNRNTTNSSNSGP